MRDVGRWLVIGLAVLVAAVAAVGYGMIASDIAAPTGASLGSVEVPAEDGAAAVFLADGRPAFVVRTGDRLHVLDARVPHDPGSPGRLALWCDAHLVDPLSDAVFGPDGRWRVGAASDGLIVYPSELTDGGRWLVVGREGDPAGASPGSRPRPAGCDSAVHAPEPGDVFDPSVAADEEPPGWVWLEGRLEAVGGEVLLCDDRAAADCPSGAAVAGIDPAQLRSLPRRLDGLFLGRIGDGVIDELHYVAQG